MENVGSTEGTTAHMNAIENADILVGIPSYNNARTIGHVVRAVQAGFAKYFPDKKAVLVNSDGGSSDGTMDVVHDSTIDNLQSILLSHKVNPFLKIATPYHGIPGKGSAFRKIFEIADSLNVQACAVVDSDLRSITPEWIELLVKPVLEEGFDYVAPLYQRHKYDGTITNSIVYPLTRALYGKRVRQPIGGDFGFSGRLAKFYLSEDVWETDVARYGIDIWMTTTAIANDFKICQAYLGAKIHDPKDPGADLSAMLYQVVGSTFDLMETYFDVWKGIADSRTVPTFGFHYDVGLEPVSVNLERMIDRFCLGVQELGLEGAVINPMHPEGAHKKTLKEPKGLGKQQRIGRLRCDAVDDLTPELLGHSLIKIGFFQSVFGPRRNCAARTRLGKPEPLIVFLCKGHCRVKTNDGKFSCHMKDGLNHRLPHFRIEIV